MSTDPLDLTRRDGLPEALRVLAAELPRADWAAHPEFHGLVSFWLERHLAFRRLCAMMAEDARQAIDGRMAPEALARRLSRLGSHLVNDLHGHHQIEDQHYFPRLMPLDPRLARGFDLLERDHDQLDGLIGGFVTSANRVLAAGGQGAGPFLDDLTRFSTLLERHLEDEEELIVPVILRHGPEGL